MVNNRPNLHFTVTDLMSDAASVIKQQQADSTRIAAAVAVLRGAADDNQYCWEVERALAILEGRAEA